jgi:PAS domain S-box-containing protein
MRDNPSNATLQQPSFLLDNRMNRLALIPVPLLVATIIILWFADLRTPHEYPLLLTILNFVFLTLAALLVVFLSWRSYLQRGEPGLLMLGCGALLWGIGGSASFVVLGKGINATVTVHNSLACLAAFCHFSGVILSRRWKKSKMPGLSLALLSTVSLVAAGLIIIMTVYGLMPVFFVQGTGGTPIRQAVLLLAIILFGHTAASLWSADQHSPFTFVRWYGTALLLLTTGLLGVLLQPAFGGLLGWVGRTAQYLGGIYMLIAVITSMRETGVSGLSLHEVLRESESRLKALSEATVEGIVISEHGRIIDVNEQFASMYGYTRNELIGTEVAKLLPPDEVERVMENIYHNIESVIEHRGLRRDGQLLTLEANARNIIYMGRPARLTTIHDITERKKIEEALLKSKESYKELVTNANSIIIRMDKSGTITFFNEYALNFFGYALDEILGKDIKILLPQTESNGKNLSEMADTILSNPDGFEENINENIRKNGERIWVLWKNKAIRDSNGNTIGNLAIGSDITERKQAEEALIRSEARYKLLSETAEQLIKFKNIQLVINDLCRKTMEHLNCQVFFNYLLKAEVGRLHLNAFSGIPDKDAKKIEWLDLGVAVCGCAALGASPIIAEKILTTSDPRTDLVKSYGIQAYACHPLMVQGKVIGTLSFGTRTRTSFSEEDLVLMKRVTAQVANAMERSRLNDELQKSRDELELRVQERTTDLEKLNEALKRSNVALEDFAHVASHDLQEPLRKIKTFGDRLAISIKAGSISEQELDYLERMQAAAVRMQTLIQELLKYSRVKSDPEHFEIINLRKPVEEAVGDLNLRLEETEGQIEIDDLPNVEANESQMHQLFLNLISNSLKYRSNQKPLIKIYSCQTSEDGFHEIHVKDNGIGFDEIYLDKIFKPFQRLHGRSSPYEGTGMGLAICQKIVEIHDGIITATSEPNKGSTFIVRLPKVY